MCETMVGVILFGVGSPIIGDFEESLYRAGLTIAAGIRNRPVPNCLSTDARVLCPEELVAELLTTPFLVPLFTPGHRHHAAREAAHIGFRNPFTLVDRSVVIPRRLELGHGTFINVGSCIGSGCSFGAFAFINRGANIGHHAKFGDFVSIGPGANIAGNVTIGAGSAIGTGATVLPSIIVGSNAVVGAGAVVTRDVPSGCLVVGNPARITRRDVGGYKGLIVA
jgi:sugar O-acyltransferase (sialic acid O-acetyltransferase NeuD family)